MVRARDFGPREAVWSRDFGVCCVVRSPPTTGHIGYVSVRNPTLP